MQIIKKNLIIILAVLITAGFGLYAYTQGNLQDGGSNNSASKEHRNDQFGFSFEYPSDLNIIDAENDQVLSHVLFTRKIGEVDGPIFGVAVLAEGIEENKPKFAAEGNTFADVNIAGKNGFKVSYGDADCTGQSYILQTRDSSLVMSTGHCDDDPFTLEEKYELLDEVVETLNFN